MGKIRNFVKRHKIISFLLVANIILWVSILIAFKVNTKGSREKTVEKIIDETKKSSGENIQENRDIKSGAYDDNYQYTGTYTLPENTTENEVEETKQPEQTPVNNTTNNGNVTGDENKNPGGDTGEENDNQGGDTGEGTDDQGGDTGGGTDDQGGDTGGGTENTDQNAQ